jgi:hypothetical protein
LSEVEGVEEDLISVSRSRKCRAEIRDASLPEYELGSRGIEWSKSSELAAIE